MGCERVDALACGSGLDADDSEDKERKKKKRKKKLLDADGSGSRSWWNAMVVVAQLMTQHV